MITRWQYYLSAAIITRRHYCISVEIVIGWIHWIVNVSNCKELWIARRNRLEMIQHSAARIIMCIKRHDRQSITAVLWRLHWLPVKWRINYRIVVLVFRALHGLAPAYVSTLITPYEPRRALRSTGSALLCVPRHNLERYGQRSFSCAGPVLWNSLPEDMRLADSLNSFKSHLKTHYFKLAYNLWLYAIRTLYVIYYIYF